MDGWMISSSQLQDAEKSTIAHLLYLFTEADTRKYLMLAAIEEVFTDSQLGDQVIYFDWCHVTACGWI